MEHATRIRIAAAVTAIFIGLLIVSGIALRSAPDAKPAASAAAPLTAVAPAPGASAATIPSSAASSATYEDQDEEGNEAYLEWDDGG